MSPEKKPSQGLTLHELAAEIGVEPRTIRSYVEKGVIPGPDTLGRGARYSRDTLDRLKVLQLLRDANRDLTLDQIRVVLQGIAPAQLKGIAEGTLRIGAVLDTDAIRGARPSKTSALDYIRAFKAGRSGSLSSPPPPASVPPTPSESWLASDQLDDETLTAFEEAARVLSSLVGLPTSARATRGETWYRIPLTPDIELSVRGEFGTEQLAQLHRIGDALRTLLTKGAPK